MKIRNKLIVYTFALILITLLVVGAVIDRTVTDLYDKNAEDELAYIISSFQRRLSHIESDIFSQSENISIDTKIIALGNLIKRYQDKQNYEPLIFDNEKKRVAGFLLDQIILTETDQAIFYDDAGDIIAFAIDGSRGRMSGISSYDQGRPVYFIKQGVGDEWVQGELPKQLVLTERKPLGFHLAENYRHGLEFFAHELGIVARYDKLVIRAGPNRSEEIVGYLRVSKLYDERFFASIFDDTSALVSAVLPDGTTLNGRGDLPISEQFERTAPSFSLRAIENVLPYIGEKYYIQGFRWTLENGDSFLVVSLPRTNLVSALNQTRFYLVMSFLVTAVLAISFGIFWLNRLISRPLRSLVETVSKNQQNYPVFPVSRADDEVSLLGKALNDMVQTIEAREYDLMLRTRQLNNAQRIAKVGDWTLDNVSRKMSWSEEAYSIFGYKQDEIEPSVEAIERVMPEEEVAKARALFRASLELQKPFDFVHRIITEDGVIKVIHVHGENFYRDGVPIETIGTIQDITEQVRRDEQLRRSQKMDALGKLTGGIAHDFNNMLGVIMGFADLLRVVLKGSGDKYEMYINEILNASERARKLTSKLLTFSRKETSNPTIESINDIVTSERHLLEKTLTARIQLQLDLEKDIWLVQLDRDELEDAILNMCINSMHAIVESGVLTLSTRNLEVLDEEAASVGIDAGEYVVLTIRDTGEGMDSHTLQHIFEPFFSTKGDKGTGLGMSQVYGFVVRSKGNIFVDSAPGRGTVITIYFPRQQIEDAVSVSTAPAISYDLSGHASILVVDDEDALRELQKQILTASGYKVVCAKNGQQALEVLQEQSFDLMISDVIMPGMNGYKLASEAKQRYPQMKIQIVSGYADVSGKEDAENEWYCDRLEKPFNSKTLLQKVKNILAHSEDHAS